MKVIMVIFLAVSFDVTAQTNALIQLPDPLVTSRGESYQDPKLLQVMPNEIVISYVDQDGVLQAENIQINDLSTNLQRQFNYNPTVAAVAESNEVAQAKFFKTSPFMSVQQRIQYEADGIAARQQMAADEAAAEAAAAEKAKEEADKERMIEAQEKLAAAAQQQANNPPVQNNTVINQTLVQQNQQNNY